MSHCQPSVLNVDLEVSQLWQKHITGCVMTSVHVPNAASAIAGWQQMKHVYTHRAYTHDSTESSFLLKNVFDLRMVGLAFVLCVEQGNISSDCQA